MNLFNIPKVIHYCWFGGNQLPELAQKCIASWKKYCPDYKIVEWNETIFDVNCCAYVKEAYEAKKWAFVSDYVRLYALYQNGGIYMDTDVELLKSLEPFLNNHAFSGFENESHIPTGIIAAEKRNSWIKLLLDDYKERHFLVNGDKKYNDFDLTTNVETITNITQKYYNLHLNNSYQDLGDVIFYPQDYFCPKDFESGKLLAYSENTVAIHHFSGSWITPVERNLLIHTKQVKRKYGSVAAKIYKNVEQFKTAYTMGNRKGMLHLLLNKVKKKLKR